MCLYLSSFLLYPFLICYVRSQKPEFLWQLWPKIKVTFSEGHVPSWDTHREPTAQGLQYRVVVKQQGLTPGQQPCFWGIKTYKGSHPDSTSNPSCPPRLWVVSNLARGSSCPATSASSSSEHMGVQQFSFGGLAHYRLCSSQTSKSGNLLHAFWNLLFQGGRKPLLQFWTCPNYNFSLLNIA